MQSQLEKDWKTTTGERDKKKVALAVGLFFLNLSLITHF